MLGQKTTKILLIEDYSGDVRLVDFMFTQPSNARHRLINSLM